MSDRCGLGWRPELALDLLRHGEQVEILEFIAEDWFKAPAKERATLRAWCRERPCHLHGVSLGLASTEAVSSERLFAWRDLLASTNPARWSEHLAFVRGGGIELGHLAAPPRTPATVAGAVANLARIQTMVGSLPLIENVATLMVPPGSTWDECTWLSAIVRASDAWLLLDLHNLYANAVNQGWDPIPALDRLPLDRVAAVHLAGGRQWRGRLLDDHLHPVPEAVFGLLEAVAARAPGDLDVFIERDGRYPPFADLLAELTLARQALARGRAQRRAFVPGLQIPPMPAVPKDGQQVEALLARLYTDAEARRQFTADPLAVGLAAGLSAELAGSIAELDQPGLELVADSLSAKRERKQH
jgi:hypothetical protein